MVDHVRKQIRDAAKTLLTGLATTGANAFTAHPFPLTDAELPGIVVAAPSERTETQEDTFGVVLKRFRIATLMVIGYAAGEDVEDVLDRIAAEVETAIGGDIRLGGLVKEIAYIGAEASVDGDTRKRTGEIRLTFEASYVTAAGDPTTAL